ncbi:RagB/SusD family nutrient uptake outer membrane protein [Pedobacter jejuensis]|uniref:RagB/SusD family nutrient uptake outer membrane protein n=2 Tax=Pedobacter jejuensis TaxID=1268550 RepID=A0A3N0C0U5_9SPHI|nr:RagB/SusD family nutrient uptake outer membrane protein [Pedobacter jejuensis]
MNMFYKTNNMKTKILMIALTLIVCSGCKKSFLELEPKTRVTANLSYISEDDYRQAVTGIYASLRGLYNDAYVMGEMRSDNANYVFNSTISGGQFISKYEIASFIDVPNNFNTKNKFVFCYQGISRANAVLRRIDASTINATLKSNLKGQAEFLRAFYYFELVQYYGDVPLYLTDLSEVNNVAETKLPRSPKADVYKQILADATDAANLLPNTPVVKGQVAKGAAKMLLGYVYMTLKQYADAERVLKEVTTLGYSLLPDYASIFLPTNKNNAESIFEIQYLQGNFGLQNGIVYQLLPATSQTVNLTGIVGNNQTTGGWNVPSADLIAAYEANDKRKAVSIATSYIDGSGNTVQQLYVKKYLNLPHFQYNNTNDDWPVYRYADALLLLAESLNEQGKNAEAITYLDQVRTRAGITTYALSGQTDLRAAIAKERRVELAFENHRWLDLVRTGQAITVMNAYGAKLKPTRPDISPLAFNVTANRLIFPIPQDELNLNNLLTQNPGY